MNFKKLVALSILLGCFSAGRSQTINIQADTIVWQVNGMTDLIGNVTVPYQCKFVTRASQDIDWVQGDGDVVTHFSITGANGDWSNPSEDGSVTYNISGDGVSGQLSLSRSSSGLSAHLQLNGGAYEINHSYPVLSYEKR